MKKHSVSQILTKQTTEGPLVRSAQLRAVAPDQEDQEYTFELSFSSEEPYERWFGMEVLGHDSKEVDLSFLQSGHAPLLVDHDARDVVGVIESAEIREGRGKARVRFGKSVRAQEIRQDVIDGIRGNVSVGYEVLEMKLVAEQDQGPDTYRVTKWRPIENSLVSIPADTTVGVGRAKTIEIPTKKENTVMETKTELKPEDVLAQERKRVSEISELGKAHKCADLAETAVKDGITIEDFRGQLLKALAGRQAPVAGKPEDNSLGLSKKEVKQYSVLKAIRCQIAGDACDAGYEKEISREVAKRFGKDPNGIYIPYDVLQRDLQIGGAGTGSNVVSTDVQSGSFIDLLRSKMVLDQLGASYLTNLVGDIAVPKQTGAATAYWITEGNSPTESQQTLAQATGTPHTVGAFTDITRKLLKQSSIDAEMFVRNDLAKVLGLAIDSAAINGTGADGQPQGLIGGSGVSGINEITISSAGTPTWAEILDFIEYIQTDNADLSAMKWLMTPEVWACLAGTEKASTTGQFIADIASKSAAGYPYVVSNQCAANTAILGCWDQLVVAMWGALDLTVDPFTGSTSGTVRIVALQDVDVMCRHGESFAYGTVTA